MASELKVIAIVLQPNVDILLLTGDDSNSIEEINDEILPPFQNPEGKIKSKLKAKGKKSVQIKRQSTRKSTLQATSDILENLNKNVLP